MHRYPTRRALNGANSPAHSKHISDSKKYLKNSHSLLQHKIWSRSSAFSIPSLPSVVLWLLMGRVLSIHVVVCIVPQSVMFVKTTVVLLFLCCFFLTVNVFVCMQKLSPLAICAVQGIFEERRWKACAGGGVCTADLMLQPQQIILSVRHESWIESNFIRIDNGKFIKFPHALIKFPDAYRNGLAGMRGWVISFVVQKENWMFGTMLASWERYVLSLPSAQRGRLCLLFVSFLPSSLYSSLGHEGT